MELQIALIAIGVVIVLVVYWLSVRRGQFKEEALDIKDEFSYNDDSLLTPSLAQGDSESMQRSEPRLFNTSPVNDVNHVVEPAASLRAAPDLDISSVADELQETARELVNDPEDSVAEDSEITIEATPVQPLDAENKDDSDDTSNPQDETLDQVKRDKAEKIENIEPKPKEALVPTFNYQAPEGFSKISQIDYWVKLSGKRDVMKEMVLGIYKNYASKLTKPHRIYGARVQDNKWSELRHEAVDARFRDVVVSIQLANTKGPIEKEELSVFSNMVVELSEKTRRNFQFMAPTKSALDQAEALYRFKKQFDKRYILNVKPVLDDHFGGVLVDRCARQLGLEPHGFHFARYKLFGKQKVRIYSIANFSDDGRIDFENIGAASFKGVTFFTRPGANKSPGGVFSEMADAAKAFASRVKGEVVTPTGENLTAHHIEAMRKEIDELHQSMDAAGIAPGCEEMKRLLSI